HPRCHHWRGWPSVLHLQGNHRRCHGWQWRRHHLHIAYEVHCQPADGCLCGSEQGCHQSPVPGRAEGHRHA
ncbi:SLC34A1, partial [Symbiodinium pilosum]